MKLYCKEGKDEQLGSRNRVYITLQVPFLHMKQFVC